MILNALGSFHTFEQWYTSVSRSIEGYPGFVVIDSILKEKHENPDYLWALVSSPHLSIMVQPKLSGIFKDFHDSSN